MTTERMIQLLDAEHQCMLRNAHGDCDRACASCDLVQDDGELHEMYTDVIALVKSCEPRVMALKEAARAEVCWVEKRHNRCIMVGNVMVYREDDYSAFINYLQPCANENIAQEDYGKTWRCWTSRPTDEQREATPWQAPSTSDSAPNG